jgi:hypothetical protein
MKECVTDADLQEYLAKYKKRGSDVMHHYKGASSDVCQENQQFDAKKVAQLLFSKRLSAAAHGMNETATQLVVDGLARLGIPATVKQGVAACWVKAFLTSLHYWPLNPPHDDVTAEKNEVDYPSTLEYLGSLRGNTFILPLEAIGAKGSSTDGFPTDFTSESLLDSWTKAFTWRDTLCKLIFQASERAAEKSRMKRDASHVLEDELAKRMCPLPVHVGGGSTGGAASA